MRLVRDTPFEVGHLTWRARPGETCVTVAVKGTFALRDGEACMLASVQRPLAGLAFHDDDPLQSVRLDTDFALFKPAGELLLAGTCHPPGDQPVPISWVSLTVGPVTKRLVVLGDRTWTSLGQATPPVPFREMPLRWERSFGGASVDANPVGTGAGSGAARALPNIEDPRALVLSPSTRPPPAGAFPVPPTWKSRLRHAGRYDARWLAQRWPDLPDDFDGRYFLAAPEDQRIAGFWRGDEVVVLENLRPGAPVVWTRLPGLRARAFLADDATGAMGEVPLRLDTLTVDADAGEVFALWRGLVELAGEALPAGALLYVVHEPLEPAATVEAHRARRDALLAAEAEVDAALDREEGPAEAPPPTEPETLDPSVIAAEAQLRALEAEHPEEDAPDALPPVDLEALRAALAGMEPGEDGETEELLQLLAEASSADADAQEVPPGAREAFLAALAAGEPVAGRDWSGVDLSGVSLRGIDLTQSVLLGCAFRGSDLEGATLTGAVFAGADLRDANLSGATLTGADLTGADATGARLDGATLADATLSGTTLTGATLVGAACAGIQLEDARLERVDLRRAVLDGADLSRAVLDGARLDEASLRDADLGGASAVGASFRGADLGALRAAGGRFAGALFTEARAAGSRWGGSVLDGAGFQHADLSRADFTRASLRVARLDACRLKHGRFEGADLTGATLVQADLFQASFESAVLQGADLRGASLYEAELWKATTDGARLERAVLTRTKLEPR